MPAYLLRVKRRGVRRPVFLEVRNKPEAKRLSAIVRKTGGRVRTTMIATREEFIAGRRVSVRTHIRRGRRVGAHMRRRSKRTWLDLTDQGGRSGPRWWER